MPQNQDKGQGYVFWIILILMIVVWVVYPKLITLIFPTAGLDPTERGVFGDMFGSLNALFSGIALVGVIYAVLMQRQELKLQRDELTLTREEMKRSAEAQVQTAEAQVQTSESIRQQL